ncbi:MAG: protein translocase subunit SecD [Gammaproteobacteria bacterium]
MLNKFPLWKNISLVIVLLIGIIYALPNLFVDEPAVQITGNKSSAKITEMLTEQVKEALETAKIPYKSIGMQDDTLLVRFKTTDDQFKARSAIKSVLSSDYTAALNLVSSTPAWLTALGAKPMKLGLDLRGGIHFLFDVDVNSVVEKRLDGITKNITDSLRLKKIRYISIDKNKNDHITLTFKDEQNAKLAKDLIESNFHELQSIRQTNPLKLDYTPTEAFIHDVQTYAIEQTTTTLRNRINELGIAEPVVQQQGANRISVDLPGLQDSARAKQIIGGTATVEFHLVSKNDPSIAVSTGIAPPGTKLYSMTDGSPILLDTQVVLSGTSITNAISSFGEDGRPVVEISLGNGGEAYFNQVTRENIGNRLAIVYVETKAVDTIVDDKLITEHKRFEHVIVAPTIQNALGGGSFQITGLGDSLEAKNLALLLRAGAMPATADIIQERMVGPSLGQENIRMGTLSVIVAFALIVVFMILYYALFGVFADIALLVNLILIVAILSILGATLTLPGIAAIVLTVGTAVDGNVLIFERIREELRGGMSIQSAINAGFERAFETIVDANLTTLIVAIVLFCVGTGPVVGFAVTLTIGLLTSMFTAVTFTRALVNVCYGGRQVKKLSIGKVSK